jgi:hypothetical protein
VSDLVANLLSTLASLPLWFWGTVLVAVLAGAAVAGWVLWRARAARKTDDAPVSWEQFVATLHDRLDQCELLLKQFAQRADKQHNELREAVTNLQGSVEALEKPFSAVASRLSQVGQDGNGRGS